MAKAEVTHYEGSPPSPYDDHTLIEKSRPYVPNGLEGAVTNEAELNQGFSRVSCL